MNNFEKTKTNFVSILWIFFFILLVFYEFFFYFVSIFSSYGIKILHKLFYAYKIFYNLVKCITRQFKTADSL